MLQARSPTKHNRYFIKSTIITTNGYHTDQWLPMVIIQIIMLIIIVLHDSYMSNESKFLTLISPRRLLPQHWHKRWLSSRSKFLIFSTCIPQSFLEDYYCGQSNFHNNSSESLVHAQSRRFATKKIQTVVFFFCIIWLF